MDNGWSKAIKVGKLPEGDARPVVVDMDPTADPVLFWAGKRNRREVPVLPLQRNEIVSDSRIAQIIDRARRAAEEKSGASRQGHLFADLEKSLRESDRSKRVEFYTHEEGWKNKLICGDSLQVMESLLHYENLRGRVQMIYIDPPYGIKYDSNFQQRVDSTKNDVDDQADDVLTIKAFRDTWTMGVHSWLSYLEERLYLCRELLRDTGSVFVQIGDEHVHRARALLDEVFGANNFVAQIPFRTKIPLRNTLLAGICDYLIWYAKDKPNVRYQKIYTDRGVGTGTQFTRVELPDGTRRPMTDEERDEPSLLPAGAKIYRLIDLNSSGLTPSCVFDVDFEGRSFPPRVGHSWKTNPSGMKRLIEQRRLEAPGESLQYVFYFDDFPYMEVTNLWSDTQGASGKRYAVQTSEKVIERCIHMSSAPGELVLDITCGSGVTALCSERWGRRWITCDTSRVAISVARKALLAAVFPHFKTWGEGLSTGFLYQSPEKVTLGALSNEREAGDLILVDKPEVDDSAIRVTGPFDVMSLGRYSVEDWKGYVVSKLGDDGTAKLVNYIEVICRLYRKDAAVQGSAGLVHAIAETEKAKIAISVGPLSGRVTDKQINDAVQDALSSGILEVHVLGWAFEANVGEVKSQLEQRGKVKVELIMIRPDTLAEGLKATQPETLFSPLALPDIDVVADKNGKAERSFRITLNGVALFDRKLRTTDYKTADSGYVSAWYLDEDYDGDCFVDCQMFFDFKKASQIKAALRADVDPEEFTLKLTSQPFPMRGYKRVAVKVVDVYGNESTVVRDLA
jgi:adenine-specific DNA-methyltransferase